MSWDISKKELERMPGVKAVKDGNEGKRPRAPAPKEESKSEAQEQRELFQVIRSLEILHPELQMIRADQAGLWTHPAQANKAKASGMRRGFPDIDVPLARGGFTGLHIELKTKNGRVSEDQEWWLEALARQGRRCEVCWSAREAWEVISGYLDIQAEGEG